ncbi:hypothetical protein [Vibrio pectenicida]|uniref:Secreted effector protein SptP N-terminal domain-containing protein n=1 Tax=Vibrio pectenicida TaxID=62763 RepID=A0A427U2Q3_9VIBR|nr:hypothetical protein [Vibrio pectenicida]RSD30952.1 hypothetical protein EJA03_11345 [Vibrio pectenicida]
MNHELLLRRLFDECQTTAPNSDLDKVDSALTLVEEYKNDWKVNSNEYKAFQQFYSSSSVALKSSMTLEMARLCFDLIIECPELNSENLANCLSEKLVQYASDMSMANMRILSEILAEKIPTLGDSVEVSFPKSEQKAQLGAIQLITQALRKSQVQLSDEQNGIDERLDFSRKMSNLHFGAAVFKDYFQQLMDSDANQEDQFEATIWAITGQEWKVSKNDKLVPSDYKDYDDLNFNTIVKKELQEYQPINDIQQIAQNVVQAQHRVFWLDQRNTVSYELNNNAGVDIYSDVESNRLVDSIIQNLPSYSDYIEEKKSALLAYVTALEVLLNQIKAVGHEVTNQVVSISRKAKQQLECFTELQRHCYAVQQVLDTKVLLGNKLIRIETMLDHTIVSIAKRINLKGFLSFLPPLRTNNERVRELVKERTDLQSKLKKQECSHIKSSIELINEEINFLDDDYQRRLLQLTQFDRQVKQKKGYPDVSGNSLESWAAWVKQNVSGSLSGDYRPDKSILLLDRQMAKSGINSYTEAYKKLFVRLSSSQETSSYSGVKKVFVDLHYWATSHSIESQVFAGNLTHAFQIIGTNSCWFGNDLATTASTIWSAGTVEKQVKDILQGHREYLPSQGTLFMTPEMIALLHLAQSAPYMAAAMKGLTGGSVMANGAGLLVSALMPAVAIAQPMEKMLDSMVQSWSENKVANIVTQQRTTEVMVNALMKGIIKPECYKNCAQLIECYSIQRQALQNIEELSKGCFKNNKLGIIRRIWQSVSNTWSEMDWKAKFFAVITTTALSIGTATISALVVISIVGTAGISFAVAVLAGFGSMCMGGYFARRVINIIVASDFLGMNNANEIARQKMTQQRIDQALKRLGSKSNSKHLIELLRSSLKDTGKSLDLNAVPVEQQEQSLRDEFIKAAKEIDTGLASQYKKIREKDVASAQAITPQTIDRAKWYECYDDIMKFIAKYAVT